MILTLLVANLLISLCICYKVFRVPLKVQGYSAGVLAHKLVTKKYNG